MWIKAMLFADEVVGSVCSDEAMSRNGMTTGMELFAFAVREQVWGKTGSDRLEDPLILGRECMHYGWYSRPDEKSLGLPPGGVSPAGLGQHNNERTIHYLSGKPRTDFIVGGLKSRARFLPSSICSSDTLFSNMVASSFAFVLPWPAARNAHL